jgi:hypothetical protein
MIADGYKHGNGSGFISQDFSSQSAAQIAAFGKPETPIRQELLQVIAELVVENMRLKKQLKELGK